VQALSAFGASEFKVALNGATPESCH